jgi:hypothetical protein
MTETELRERLAAAEEAIDKLAIAAAQTSICASNCDFCRQTATAALDAVAESHPHLQLAYWRNNVDPDAVRRHLFELAHYLSTWCWHGHHKQCKGRCKMVDFDECDQVCRCECHTAMT